MLKTDLSIARFKDFDVVFGVSGMMRRIAKIMFARDGSIYVFFPGFRSTEGILCRAKLIAGTSYPTNIDLSEGGKVASHLVKYSHHTDGEAHFSQDGKVKTEIRRRSVPLTEQRGHLFTIQVQGFDSFPCLPNAKSRQLTFNLPDDVSAIKLTAWRFPLSGINFPEIIAPGAIPVIKTSDGIDRAGLMVLPPVGMPFDDVVLFLSAQVTSSLSLDQSAQLLFMGGFDPPSIALNHAHDTEFIAFSYPCTDFETLKARIGSIDFDSDTSSTSAL
jgi:hypothetical protein